MKKVLLGAIFALTMVGCGVQTTPTINTNVTPDIQSIVASHNLKPLATTSSNLLTNGDFEDGITAWTGCDVGVANKSSDSQTGDGAISVDNNCFFQSVNIEVGKSYTLSCQVKETIDSGWTGMGFNFTDVDWAIVAEEVSTEVLADDYTLYGITRQAPETATYGTVWVFSSGSASVDNCSIVEGSVVTPPAPVLPPAPAMPTPVTPVAPLPPMPIEPTLPTPVTPAPAIPTPVTPVAPLPLPPMPVEPTLPAPVTPVTPVTPMPVEPISPVAPNSITDIAIGAGLSKLVAALKLTSLDAILAETAGGPYTVFAPTDAAFDSLLASLNITFEELAADADLVKEILLYHVIADELSLETLVDAQAMGDTRFETLQDAEDVDFGVFDGILYLGDLSGRKIVASATDVMASNGIVHVIDSVLLPPSVQDGLLGHE